MLSWGTVLGQNTDPRKTEIVTSDLDNFWLAFEASKPNFDPAVFEQLYTKKGSKGIKGFTSNRIRNAEYLAKVVAAHSKYYGSIKSSLDNIGGMKDQIIASLVKLKGLYPACRDFSTCVFCDWGSELWRNNFRRRTYYWSGIIRPVTNNAYR